MMYIHHRFNTIEQLEKISTNDGAEIDIRSDIGQPGELILHHDPWSNGILFKGWLEQWVRRYQNGTLILNTKEDGLETRAMQICEDYGVENYLFLDTAFPTFKHWTINQSHKKFMARLSSFESLDSLRLFEGRVSWVWVDCFEGIPLDEQIVAQAAAKFKLCLVSPELQKRELGDIKNFLHLAKYCSAICTKSPSTWIKLGIGGVDS